MQTSNVALIGGLFSTSIAEELGAIPLEASPLPLPLVVLPSMIPRSRAAQRSAQRTAYFGPVTVPAPAVVPAWFKAVHPDRALRHEGPVRSARRPFHFAPVDRPFEPTTFLGVIPFVQPQRPIYGRRTAHLRPSFFGPPGFGGVLSGSSGTTPIGPAGTVLAMEWETGAQISYSWLSPVSKTMSGLEQRMASMRMPRETYRFFTELTDAQQRYILSKLTGDGPSAPVWLLGLQHEAITVMSSTSSIITVGNTILNYCDWARKGQRIVVLHKDGITYLEGLITSTPGGGQINVNVDMTSVAVEGAQVFPLMAVFLRWAAMSTTRGAGR